MRAPKHWSLFVDANILVNQTMTMTNFLIQDWIAGTDHAEVQTPLSISTKSFPDMNSASANSNTVDTYKFYAFTRLA